MRRLGQILTSIRCNEILHNDMFKRLHYPSFVQLHINSVDVMPAVSILQRLNLLNSEMANRTYENTRQIQKDTQKKTKNNVLYKTNKAKLLRPSGHKLEQQLQRKHPSMLKISYDQLHARMINNTSLGMTANQ